MQYYHTEDSIGNDYEFPLLSNDAPYAKFVILADRDRMKPEQRHTLYNDISAKKALINKYLKRIVALVEIEAHLSMHMNRHAFDHIALEKGMESATIKDLLGHSNLVTTERYMGGL